MNNVALLAKSILLAAFVVGLWASRALSAEMQIIDLGTLGGSTSYAEAINGRGQVVGNSDTANLEWHAFLWENGQMIDLGTLGGTYSEAEAINDRGQVVGRSTTASGEPHAFLWESGRMIDLGTLGGAVSGAVAINNRGQVVGDAFAANLVPHAFLWENGQMIDLGTLGVTGSLAVDINDRGQVVGNSTPIGGGNHAFLWENGRMIDLGTLGGKTEGIPEGYSEAFAINDRGQVVGTSDTANLEQHAFLSENGRMIDLGTLGCGNSQARTINNRGQVAGQSCAASGAQHAFLWENGQMIDLGTLGGTYSAAVAINDRGQVIGFSGSASGGAHAVLWQEVTPPHPFEGNWQLNPGDRSYLGDFDGDGKAEIFVRSAGYAGILSYAGSQLTTWTVAADSIGGWKLSPHDQSFVGDFDGDGRDEIFVRSASYAGMLSYQGFQLINPTIASGWVGGWQLGPGDKSYVGDFDGDGKDEIFVQSWIYAGILSYDGSSLTSQTIGVGAVGDWSLNINDQSYVGDFNGDGKDELFVRSANYAGLISYDGVQFHGQNLAFGWIGSWQLGSSDQSYVGDFDGDGQDDIFVTTYRYAGLLSNKQGQWGSETVVEGWIGGWRLDAADTATIGDLDGDGTEEIFMRSAGNAAVLRDENFQLTSPTIVGGSVGGWHLSASDQSYAGDLNGDGKDEVFVRSPGYAGLLNYEGGQLGSQSVVGGTVGPPSP